MVLILEVLHLGVDKKSLIFGGTVTGIGSGFRLLQFLIPHLCLAHTFSLSRRRGALLLVDSRLDLLGLYPARLPRTGVEVGLRRLPLPCFVLHCSLTGVHVQFVGILRLGLGQLNILLPSGPCGLAGLAC
jgi:hypothetical protein